MFAKRHPGFTLIEMLVVIGIIAVLVAFMLPVFASVRHRGRMTVCASNLHQISLALHQYAAENDGNYPPDDPVLAHNPHLVWTSLTPYTHSPEIFHCPDALGTFEKSRGYFYIYGSLPYISIGGITPKAPRPGSGTVVAFCEAHTKRAGSDGYVFDGQGKEIGPLVVVREDGSTSQVQANLVEPWIYRQGRWMPGQGVSPQPGGLGAGAVPWRGVAAAGLT